MTSDKHERALDRVAEAIENSDFEISEDDIVLNVQGDEPMMQPDMISATVKPMIDNADVNGVVLSMPIIDEVQFNDPNTVKIIHNIKGDILYTSRAPIPYCKEWSLDIEAKRIYGIFGFRWDFLRKFTKMPESPLELVETCDVIIIGQKNPQFIDILKDLKNHQHVIDLVGIAPTIETEAVYDGICW